MSKVALNEVFTFTERVEGAIEAVNRIDSLIEEIRNVRRPLGPTELEALGRLNRALLAVQGQVNMYDRIEPLPLRRLQ